MCYTFGQCYGRFLSTQNTSFLTLSLISDCSFSASLPFHFALCHRTDGKTWTSNLLLRGETPARSHSGWERREGKKRRLRRRQKKNKGEGTEKEREKNPLSTPNLSPPWTMSERSTASSSSGADVDEESGRGLSMHRGDDDLPARKFSTEDRSDRRRGEERDSQNHSLEEEEESMLSEIVEEERHQSRKSSVSLWKIIAFLIGLLVGFPVLLTGAVKNMNLHPRQYPVLLNLCCTQLHLPSASSSSSSSPSFCSFTPLSAQDSCEPLTLRNRSAPTPVTFVVDVKTESEVLSQPHHLMLSLPPDTTASGWVQVKSKDGRVLLSTDLPSSSSSSPLTPLPRYWAKNLLPFPQSTTLGSSFVPPSDVSLSVELHNVSISDSKDRLRWNIYGGSSYGNFPVFLLSTSGGKTETSALATLIVGAVLSLPVVYFLLRFV